MADAIITGTVAVIPDLTTSGGGGTGDIEGVTAGTGLSGGGTSGTVVINLADTAVTPGSYTYTALTVDQQGRLTAASSGAAPAPATRQVIAGAGMTGGGALTSDVTLNVVAADTTITVTADAIAVGTITNTNIDAAATIAHSKLADLAGASVLGRSASSSGAMAAITGVTTGHVLTVQAGPTLAFAAAAAGAIDGSGAATRVAIWSDADTLTSNAGFTLTSNILTHTAASSAGVVSHVVENSSNTASSQALMAVTVGGATADDAIYRATISGGQVWTWGLDNSDADAFVISSGTTLGTNNCLKIGATGTVGTTLQNFGATAKLSLNDSAGVTLQYTTDEYILIDSANINLAVAAGNGLRVMTGSTQANLAFMGTGSFGAGFGVISIANAVTPPSANPVGGGILYCDAGALKYRGTSGTVTTVGPA